MNYTALADVASATSVCLELLASMEMLSFIPSPRRLLSDGDKRWHEYSNQKSKNSYELYKKRF
ncbi:MAG: hypothetical protein QXG05_01910 [Nitrososphaerota archaeon]